VILRGWSPVRPGVRASVVAALTSLLVLALPSVDFAHDIPSSVRLFVFIRPQGHMLRVAVRAPLEAMRDVNFPLVGPGYLDIPRSAPLLRDAARVWLANDLHFYENGTPLADANIVAARVSLPSDRSFASFDSAVANAMSPALDSTTQVMWKQAVIDVVLEYHVASDSSRFSVDPGLARLGIRTTTVLRFLPATGGERDFEYLGDPGLVHLDPRWSQAALSFVRLGFGHILTGFDHLLFLLCLVIPFRRMRPLVLIVTAFTVAHSVTLIASAYGLAPDALWFPPLVETLIATSIVYMALENVVFVARGPGVSGVRRRWMITFAFGLVHGFGFSFALRESLQFAGSHLLTSLLSFNVGVEIGQLLVLLVCVPALQALFTYMVEERLGTIILSAFVAHTAWHWTGDRFERLRQFAWPALDPAVLASALRWAMLVVAIGGILWFAARVRHQRAAASMGAQD
jgi:HupE/UreJ protein